MSATGTSAAWLSKVSNPEIAPNMSTLGEVAPLVAAYRTSGGEERIAQSDL
jgi:hypothetical protein